MAAEFKWNDWDVPGEWAVINKYGDIVQRGEVVLEYEEVEDGIHGQIWDFVGAPIIVRPGDTLHWREPLNRT